MVIRDITIEGNKRTKKRVILRELDFAINDTISSDQMQILIEKNQKLVYNTELFNKVTISYDPLVLQDITILIFVEERWYIFPIPIFELADRNFNVWWSEHNRDLSRTEYGIRFIQKNFRGRNEELKLVLQAGYTEKYELFYEIPFIDKKQIFGTKFSISYLNNKQITYKTLFNKQQFLKTAFNSRTKLYTGVTFSMRKALFSSHYLKFEYKNNSIPDTVFQLNDQYFTNGALSQQYVFVEYRFEKDLRDLKCYPRTGSYTDIIIAKSGFGIFNDVDITELMVKYARYWEINENAFFAARVKTRLSFPKKQPYFNQSGLGFGQDFVRGYEYYVIESQHYGLFRSSLKHHLFSFEIKNAPLIPLKQFKTIPIAFLIKIYFDAGYAYEEFENSSNNFNKKIVPGWGIGLDITSYYDMVIRLEYSFNNLFEKGLYLHFELDI